MGQARGAHILLGTVVRLFIPASVHLYTVCTPLNNYLVPAWPPATKKSQWPIALYDIVHHHYGHYFETHIIVFK